MILICFKGRKGFNDSRFWAVNSLKTTIFFIAKEISMALARNFTDQRLTFSPNLSVQYGHLLVSEKNKELQQI